MRRARTSPHVGVAASSPSLRPAEDDWLPGWLPADEHSSEKISLSCAPSSVQPQDIKDRVSQDIEDSDWGDSGVAAGLAGGLP